MHITKMLYNLHLRFADRFLVSPNFDGILHHKNIQAASALGDPLKVMTILTNNKTTRQHRLDWNANHVNFWM
jgi:transcriptional regulator of met regulon